MSKEKMIDDLMNMTVAELLDEFCLIYNPDCGITYGVGRWDDANEIYEEFDLDDQYCFSSDFLIPIDYGFDCGEKVLDLDDLKYIMDRLGIVKRQPCPKCGSEDYHFDYNQMGMLCNDCGYSEKGD